MIDRYLDQKAKHLISIGYKVIPKNPETGTPLFSDNEKGSKNNPLQTADEVDAVLDKHPNAGFYFIEEELLKGEQIIRDIKNIEFPQKLLDEFEEQVRKRDLKAAIEEFVGDEPGFFTVSQLDAELGIKQEEKNYRKQILHRLAEKGKIERGNQRGLYRIKNKEKRGMNFIRIKKTEISLPLPLDLSNYVRIAPKNVIIIAGATNAGKTAFVMNIAHSILNDNAVKVSELTGEQVSRRAKLSDNYVISSRLDGKPLSVLLGEQITGKSEPVKVLYMNSEMSEIELNMRFEEFPGGAESFDHSNFEVIEREADFHDIVEPDGINLIDYLPVHDKFWLVADKIKKIHDRLNKGIAVICIQKRGDKPYARGGEFTLELCRLGIALDNNDPYGHICSVLKNKIPLDPRHKLAGESRDFKLGGGACIKPISEWRYVKNQKHRAEINAEYESEAKAKIADEKMNMKRDTVENLT